MLCKKTLDAVLGFAMAKYAAENNGKNGISKSDVKELVRLHGGSSDDVSRVILLALESMMPEGTWLM